MSILTNKRGQCNFAGKTRNTRRYHCWEIEHAALLSVGFASGNEDEEGRWFRGGAGKWRFFRDAIAAKHFYAQFDVGGYAIVECSNDAEPPPLPVDMSAGAYALALAYSGDTSWQSIRLLREDIFRALWGRR